MKLNRSYLFIAVSSIALLIVLIIQVNWIIQTAKIKEEFFNEKANMVLARTTEALSADKQACGKIGECVERNSTGETVAVLETKEQHKIDSLFKYYMKFYNFHIAYSYEIIKSDPAVINRFASFIYNKPLEAANNNEIELKLILPKKKEYIVAEMGTMFITSVMLIIIVLILFWRTVLSLIREKRISEHTTDFLNNMTHEFKTPLTNIALAGKMIIKDSSIGQEEKIKHYSGIILEENEKLRLQVEQVLSMTALERDEIPLRKSDFDFHELIKDCLKSMSIQIENRQGNIKVHLDANQYMLHGDKTHLTNAICNLIDNAIKYSKDKPELSIRTTNSGQNLVVFISDNGIGIDKEYHKNVFNKFFRVPTGDVHDVKGFGLGLAYVKKIVELHGGAVVLDSEKGKGSTFTINLPCLQ